MKLSDVICAKGNDAGKLKEALSRTTFVGIDFGTSTTTVTRASFEDGIVLPVPLAVPQEDLQGVKTWDHLVPTVVAMKPDGHLLFGHGAKECPLFDQAYREGANVWTFCKMRLGEHACYPQSLMTRHNTPVAGVVIESPKDAAMHFFAYLKHAVEEAVRKENLPNDIRYAITVPASFAPNQREELCEAVRKAGIVLDPRALLDEPNAAFLGAASEYLSQGGADVFFRGEEPSRVLVFDFGAGTCDISLLKVSPNLEMQNLAISHFTALGGRDLDEKIARDVLYPQLIEGRSGDDIPVMSVRQQLIDRLMPIAERMKIAMCSRLDDPYGGKAFEMAAASPDVAEEERFSFATERYGFIESESLKMTAADFAKIMREFSEDPEEAFDNDRKSIFEPIENVLNKVAFKKDDIDFVLLVGGSCLNPFVRDLVEEYFPGTVQVVEIRDPQILVAEGASIHAMTYYGLEANLIAPILSDEIQIRTPGGTVTVFEAGTPVPANWKEIGGLYIDDESAEKGVFGIPFLTANGNREIGVARFELPNLAIGCEVMLTCSLIANKELSYRIHANGRDFFGVLQMPLSSEVVDERMRGYIEAKNKLDYYALINKGTAPADSYLAVAKACRKIGKHEEEAEYYRQLMYSYRNLHYEYEAACAFRDALKRRQALSWSRRAFAHEKDYLNIWYLIWDLAAVNGWDDPEIGPLIERALYGWPDDLDFKYVDMKCMEGCGDKDGAREVAESLCAAWEKKGVQNLGRYTLIRFEEVAQKCGRRDLAVEIRKCKAKFSDDDHREGGLANYAIVRSRDVDNRSGGHK